MKAKWFGLILVLMLLATSLVPSANAAPNMQDDGPIYAAKGIDNHPHPLGDKQKALRLKAEEAQIYGKTKGNVFESERGQFVNLKQGGGDRIFVIVAEFGDTIHPAYGGTAGPLHNEIPKPDRTLDNSTTWIPDYNQAHYQDMYFTQMLDYYQHQSSGQYYFSGDVIDWVKVPFNEARYGNNSCGSSNCSTVWYLIRDAINQWVADRKAAGMTNQQIHDYLATFDQYDRYDSNGNGNFYESDGYIDHFQIVHAGEGEEAGGGAQGTDAIWSHRWYTAYQGIGTWGPNGLGGMEFGGAGQFGQLGGANATGVWVGDYTMQPENGGLGVFAHEYGHDLGLDDMYDTAGGDNSTAFWTLMSSGSWLGDGKFDIGSKPGDMSVREKAWLGWVSMPTIWDPSGVATVTVGPAEGGTSAPQAVVIPLPYKKVVVNLAKPYAGSHFYYSGAGDNLDRKMTRSVKLPAGTVSFSAWVNFDIELDWDYAYLTVNGNPVATNLSSASNPNGQNFGGGITGSTGGKWVNLTADLSDFAGQTVDLGFRYWTDGALTRPGFMVDNIEITGLALDGAEGDAGWSFAGFWISTGTEVDYYSHYYVAEYRQYRDYDSTLKVGPYNFGFPLTKPNWVEHFPYQDGLLIWYRDTSQSDNNTSQHPGSGYLLPIDSHPAALYRPVDNAPWRSRVQAYDSPFTLGAPTDGFTLHYKNLPSNIPSQPAVSVFNDSKQYWNPETPLAGAMNPHTGTAIQILSDNGTTMNLRITMPMINIKGKGVSIAPYDSTPSATDGTLFGDLDLNSGVETHVFTIENPGKGSLFLNGTPKVEIQGPAADDFTVITEPASPVAPGASTTFKLQFNPQRAGLREALVVISNSAANSTEYAFAVAGSATANLKNYVKNGGFEYPTALTNVPLYWLPGNLEASEGRVTDVKKAGVASAKIAAGPNPKVLTQPVSVSGMAGDYMIFSFWVKGNGVPKGAACSLTLTFKYGAAQSFQKQFACPNGFYDFKKVSVAFNAPKDYTSAVVRISYQPNALGAVWFDDVTLWK